MPCRHRQDSAKRVVMAGPLLPHSSRLAAGARPPVSRNRPPHSPAHLDAACPLEHQSGLRPTVARRGRRSRPGLTSGRWRTAVSAPSTARRIDIQARFHRHHFCDRAMPFKPAASPPPATATVTVPTVTSDGLPGSPDSGGAVRPGRAWAVQSPSVGEHHARPAPHRRAETRRERREPRPEVRTQGRALGPVAKSGAKAERKAEPGAGAERRGWRPGPRGEVRRQAEAGCGFRRILIARSGRS